MSFNDNDMLKGKSEDYMQGFFAGKKEGVERGFKTGYKDALLDVVEMIENFKKEMR